MMPINKFPFSILQELCMKQKYNLTHEVIESDTPCSPSFWYQITCNDLVTRGQGRTKKEAKHAAAEKMLELLENKSHLSVTMGTDESSIVDDSFAPSSLYYETLLKENAVVPLNDLCSEYSIVTFPTYENVREEGPAHAKVFTVRCFIKSLGVEATNRTKKQAKQCAALQMMTLLKKSVKSAEIFKKNFDLIAEDIKERSFQEVLSHFSNNVLYVYSKYQPGDLTSNLISNHSRLLSNETISNFLNQNEKVFEKNEVENLKSFLKEAEINFSLVPILSNHTNKCILALIIDISPKLIIHEIGSTYHEALNKVVQKTLEFLKFIYVPKCSNNFENKSFEDLINMKII